MAVVKSVELDDPVPFSEQAEWHKNKVRDIHLLPDYEYEGDARITEYLSVLIPSKGPLNAFIHWLKTTFPPLVWVPNYINTPEYLINDFLAGIVVGCMLVPQGLSYSVLAGLPPIYGLYSAYMPAFIYSLFGTSRQVAIGPVALIALLTQTALIPYGAPIGPTGTVNTLVKAKYASHLAFIVGAIWTAMGLLRLGWIIDFVSQPVFSGFVSAAGFNIMGTQLKYMFGVPKPKKSQLHHTKWGVRNYKTYEFMKSVKHVFNSNNIKIWDRKSVNIAWTMLGALLALRLYKKFLPRPKVGEAITLQSIKDKYWIFWWTTRLICDLGPLFACIGGAYWARNLYHHDLGLGNGVITPQTPRGGVKIIGALASGLPDAKYDIPTMEHFSALITDAIPIVIVGYLETIGVDTIMARKLGYKINPTQELTAIGMANLVGSFYRGMPVVGSFSRTAVMGSIPSKTQLSGIVIASTIVLSLTKLTTTFYWIPYAALAAIIENAILSLIDFPAFYDCFRADKREFLAMLATFWVTLLIGVAQGIYTGIALSIALYLLKSGSSRNLVLGKHGKQYRDVHSAPEAEEPKGILIVRPTADLFFANSPKTSLFIEEEVELRQNAASPIHTVLIDSLLMTDADATAITLLAGVAQVLKRQGKSLYFSNLTTVLRNRLLKSDLVKEVPVEHLLQDDIQEVVDEINAEKLKQTLEKPEDTELGIKISTL